MKEPANVQDKFLNKLIADQQRVCIMLINGLELTGTITEYDNFTILLKATEENLIFKHSIILITPE